MGNVARLVRGDWRLILASIVLPAVAVYFLLPVRTLGRSDLDDPPVGRFVEVTFDRVQPLPWTVVDKYSKLVTGRFVLGWLGDRALLVQTGVEIPPGLTFAGALNGLGGAPKTWVAAEPAFARVTCHALLEVTSSYKRLGYGFGSLALSLAVAVFWVRRFRTRNGPPATWRATNSLVPLLETARPRTDEVVAAVVRKHASPLGVALYFILYALLVMTPPGLIVGDWLDPRMWDTPARTFGMFAAGFVLAAPVSILPFVWWMRRHRGEFARVARNGELVAGFVVAATAQGTRHGWSSQRWVTAVFVDVPGEVVSRRYRATVTGPGWLRPGAAVRLLATPDDRHAVVITPSGEDFAARRTKITWHVQFPEMRLRPPPRRAR